VQDEVLRSECVFQWYVGYTARSEESVVKWGNEEVAEDGGE
jgi:hypothetical protein